jgi:hypothetical protein
MGASPDRRILCELEGLTTLILGVRKDMADNQAELDTAIAAQTSTITASIASATAAGAAAINQVAADLQAVIAKLGSIGAPPDLTAEVTAIQGNTASIAAGLTAATQAVQAAVTADNTATQGATGSIPVVPNPAPVTPAT